jgi:hypothetical protein
VRFGHSALFLQFVDIKLPILLISIERNSNIIVSESAMHGDVLQCRENRAAVAYLLRMRLPDTTGCQKRRLSGFPLHFCGLRRLWI